MSNLKLGEKQHQIYVLIHYDAILVTIWRRLSASDLQGLITNISVHQLKPFSKISR